MFNHQLQFERRTGQDSRSQMMNATVIIDPSHRNEARPISTPNDGSVVCVMNWFIVSTHFRILGAPCRCSAVPPAAESSV